ncbi:hypothetical protein ACWD5Q_28090 [Streptomyces sp. NPDC002513]
MIYVAALKAQNKGSSPYCAEDLCDQEAVKNGSAKEDLQFTKAIGPRGGQEVEICLRCQGIHELEQFRASGANFRPGGRLDLQQGSNSALAQEEAEELAEAEAEGMAEGMVMGLEDE